MVGALVGTLPFAADAPTRVIDLGCGSGTVARCVVDRFQDARITCLDVAVNMIAAAREKLAGRGTPTFIVGDFTSAELGGPYDPSYPRWRFTTSRVRAKSRRCTAASTRPWRPGASL
jgi:tRNA (cmo5U34)-methyltransferase